MSDHVLAAKPPALIETECPSCRHAITFRAEAIGESKLCQKCGNQMDLLDNSRHKLSKDGQIWFWLAFPVMFRLAAMLPGIRVVAAPMLPFYNCLIAIFYPAWVVYALVYFVRLNAKRGL